MNWSFLKCWESKRRAAPKVYAYVQQWWTGPPGHRAARVGDILAARAKCSNCQNGGGGSRFFVGGGREKR